MIMLKLLIDTREKELIEKLSEEKYDNYEIKQLDIGDILFLDKDDNVVLIIERKTISDLKASILDGRAREQKYRLLNSFETKRILYIIEGNINKNTGISTSTLLGSIINTQLRDDIKVYKTTSSKETCNFITKLHDKLEKDGDKYFKTEKQEIDYNKCLKQSKKSNMTPNVFFKHSLSSIPGVSLNIASVIVDKYLSIQNLIMEYSKLENEKDKIGLLKNLEIEIKNGKKRKIGIKISEKIFMFLHGKALGE